MSTPVNPSDTADATDLGTATVPTVTIDARKGDARDRAAKGKESLARAINALAALAAELLGSESAPVVDAIRRAAHRQGILEPEPDPSSYYRHPPTGKDRP